MVVGPANGSSADSPFRNATTDCKARQSSLLYWISLSFMGLLLLRVHWSCQTMLSIPDAPLVDQLNPTHDAMLFRSFRSTGK